MTGLARSHDGTGIAWDTYGSGDPVLLVCGQALDSTKWGAVATDLAATHRVITFDHRGTGRSELGDEGGYSTRAFALDALAVLDDAGIDRAHVYGHSMGGRVAQWLAVDAPERVRALVLGATTGGDEGGVPRHPEATADLVSGDPERLARLFFRDGRGPTDPQDFFALSASPRALALHRRASRGHDAWDRLGAITAPTLVIHGADDEMTPPGNAELLAERIPGARLELLPGSRHGYHLDDPEATQIVMDFIGGRSPSDP